MPRYWKESHGLHIALEQLVSPSSSVLMCILLQLLSTSLLSSVGSDDHEKKFAGEKFGLVDSTEGALGEYNSRQVGGSGVS